MRTYKDAIYSIFKFNSPFVTFDTSRDRARLTQPMAGYDESQPGTAVLPATAQQQLHTTVRPPHILDSLPLPG